MNIAVIGTGGVGGYFGGKLTRLLKEDNDLNIYFIARGRHLDEIRKNGLLLKTEEGQAICRPTLATDKIAELPILDLCLLCVKSYSLAGVLALLKPKIRDTSMILPLLNGVDIYERIRAVIPYGIVFPSCVYIGTHIESPGVVAQKGGAGNIIFGKDPKNNTVPQVIFDIFGKAGIKHTWADDPYREIWGKFVFIASFGLVTAALNKTIGEVLASAELSVPVRGIMKEIVEIASRQQAHLPASIIDDTFKKAEGFPYETKTSFQRDYEIADKPDEREIFGGAIIKMGKQLGIRTEVTEMIYDSIEKKKP